ncbi:MAG: membrane protein insertase YidC [Verrucomicrobiota bacterium]|jgi:YidC/Oxa1 family membrane protein insertase|nr:membrane protein insertase YidC [Verrucomicrobiota bacterium]MDP7051772.1 membrane protein insertase YidC [Verrucomicrobiota bacterium]
MDRTAIIVVTICVILLFTWPALLEKTSPTPPQPTNAPPAQVAGQTNAPVTAPIAQAQPTPVSNTITTRPPVVPETESTKIVKTPDAVYTFSNAGGLKTVAFTAHKAKPCNGSGTANPEVIHLNQGIDLPLFALEGVDDAEFSLTPERNRLTMVSTNQAGIRITKDFSAEANYLLNSTITLANTKNEPVTLNKRKLILGTAMPLQAGGGYPVWGAQWHNGEDLEDIDDSWFANRTLGCFPGTPRPHFISPGQPVKWVGIHNRFFAITTMLGAEVAGGRVYSHKTTHRLLNEPQNEDEQYIHHTGILASLQFEAQVLQPGQSVIQQYTTYAGPKEFRTLEAHAQTFKNSIDSVMGFDTPVFGFFAKLLLRSMNGLHSFGLGYAMCIIVITIIIKILFWPLTKASTVSMKRMAAYQPQMAEIREKYKEDPQKMNKRMMEFMREHKINPMGGCLPILIQIPVFFGFFTMLRSAVELRGAQFLWACDLSQTDTIAHVASFPINPLPIIMGVTMILQARMTPVSPTADPTQQKIMKYMPLMFIVILYNFSAGLTLYWTVQNMLSILQTKLTKNIVVDAPAKISDSPLAKQPRSKSKHKKKSKPKS